MISRIRRALAVTALVVVLPAIAAATVAFQILDHPDWTDPKPHPTARPTATPTAAPSTKRPATDGPNAFIGRCAIPTQADAVLTPCGTPGALKIVGTVRQDAAGEQPCRTTPFTREVRHHGGYVLCLGAP
ncbi:hypothetical protein [Streptomyces sp. DSM 40484]|uniref:hypothetical protein n=1 Tax=Streptomyces kroppenstedtii TaxID=3051181 RepID=UPI0028D64F14|nr:hypothetical protein [Streptomyces sp. DSM 40484]